MKKTTYCLMICLVLLLLLLTACGGEAPASNTDTVEYQGRTYVIEYNPNSTSGTITVEGMVCEFSVTGNGGHTRFEVTYPDGSSYSWIDHGSGGYGGRSGDYAPPSYAKGDVLWDVLDAVGGDEKGNRSGPIFLGLLVAGLGLIDVIWPRVGWYLSRGWYFRGAEPSEAALFFGRLSGILIVLLGLGVMFFA